MEGLIAAVGAFGFVALLVLGVLTIFIPISIYSGQKYAYKCFHELKITNGHLAALNEQVAAQSEQVAAQSEQIAGQQRALYKLTRGLYLAGGIPDPDGTSD